MVFFARNTQSAEEAVTLARQINCDLWVGSDCMSEQEHKFLIGNGLRVTRFSFPVEDASREILDNALATIREHHPEAIIWVSPLA